MGIKHPAVSGRDILPTDYDDAHVFDGTPGMLLGADGEEIDPASVGGAVSGAPYTVQGFDQSGDVLGVDYVTVEMFGGGINKSENENYAAFMDALQRMPDPTRNYSPTVRLGLGAYNIATTLEPRAVHHLKGQGRLINSGATGYTGTKLVFPVNTLGILISASNTTGQSLAVNGPSAGQSIIEGVTIQQAGSPTLLTAHGIQARSTPVLRDVAVLNVGGSGFHISGSAGYGGALEGNCNDWRMTDCRAQDCGGHGLYVQGQDANAGINIGFVTHGDIGHCGIWDGGVLPNTHITPQLTGYGDRGVWYGGRRYMLINGHGVANVTTPGTDPTVWYDLGPQASANSQFPLWASGEVQYIKAPFYSGGPAVVVNPYVESGATLIHAPEAMILGSVNRTHYTAGFGRIIGNGVASNKAVGQYRAGGDTTGPLYASIGDAEYTQVGGADPYASGPFDRSAILMHSVKGYDPLLLHWSADNVIFRHHNQPVIWSYSGPATARTYGRSTAQPYMFTTHGNLVVGDAGGDGRIWASGTAAPTSGYHAAGEIVWNHGATAGGTLCWVCTTAGAPGTWTAVGVSGSAPTSIVGITGSVAEFNAALTGADFATGGGTATGTNTGDQDLSGYSTTSHNHSGVYAPVSHNHIIGDVTGLQAALDGKQASGAYVTATSALTPSSVAATGGMTTTAGGIGYAAGAGGTVTQATSKATAVTLNKLTGNITMHNAALAAGAVVTFALTNSTITAEDQLIVTHHSGGTIGPYLINGRATGVGTGSIAVRNTSAGSLTEAIVLKVTVIKAVNA